MKLTNKAQAALQEADTRAVTIEMTEPRKEKFRALTAELTDILKEATEGPMEAYMVLQFMMHSFEETFGIRGGIIVDERDQA